MRRPLGCLTGTALITAGLAVVVILALAALTGNGIFSPGPLSGVVHAGAVGGVASHAELEGRCAACHPGVLSGQRMADLCLTCHTVVKGEIAARGGLHGRLLTAAGNCRTCHTDHRGATASLTLADPRVFPHAQTGYVLTAHLATAPDGSFGCRNCHPASPVSFSAPTCAGCHQALDTRFMARHEATFGTTCLSCHDGVDSYGKAFQHPAFPLTGGHQSVQCSGCHRGATTLAALRATATACVTCHAARDIHEGRLGTNCAECHSNATWADATIDHDRTRFALVGKHVGGICESCHIDRQWTGIGLTCRSCHAAADPHAGQFPGDCAACHAATGWKDVTFNHAKTRFALALAHAKPACAACHPGGRYVGTPLSCIGCHAASDKHNGALGKDCAACHVATTWADVTFNHSKTRFALTLAHAKPACVACHPGGRYAGTPLTCIGCHAAKDKHKGAFGTNCAACHRATTWADWTFDHNKAAFRLTGAHLKVTCARCHVGGVFKGTPKTCSACHAKPSSHGSGFSNSCAACHSTSAWRPASFNGPHPFPMNHGGAGGRCASCHPSSYFSYTCARCHSAASMADKHRDVSGFSQTGCVRCHPTGRGGDD